MDRRSWLWRRKSSEKSPNAETDSSESVSSHSERISDEQALSVLNINSPEVTSKPSPTYDELLSSVKILSTKLSEALQNIVAKEESVKQHAKVAEEAVSGWEKAENEALLLKKQLDVVTEKNSALEERVGQLDGALKECLRQLRQAREDKEQKIHDAIAEKKCLWEFEKVEFENQITELQSLLESTETDCVTSTFPDLCIKLEAAERENSELRAHLLSRDRELKRMISERDLSTLAAETASKQYLESIKKVAKLEAECRKLNMLAHKTALSNEYRPATASSSVYAESYSKSQSDFGEGSICDDIARYDGLEPKPGSTRLRHSDLKVEVDAFNNDKNLRKNAAPSQDIDLMDDFLEMEKFASEDNNNKPSREETDDKVETLINQNTELEEKLRKTEAEKVKLKIDLFNCQDHIKASRDQLEGTLVNLIDLQNQLEVTNEARKAAESEVQFVKAMLKKSTSDLQKAELRVTELQNQLTEAKDLAAEDLEASNEKLAKSVKCLEEAEVELVELRTQLFSLNASKRDTEAELQSMKINKEVTESRLKSLELENHTLQIKISSLELDIQNERNLLLETVAKCQKLNDEISLMKSESQVQKTSKLFDQDKELATAASKFADCQKTIASLDRQLKSLAALEDVLNDSEMSPAITV